MEIKENYKTTLETQDLILAPWELNFVPAMYKNWATDKDVTKFLAWQPHKNQEETKQIVLNFINESNYNWCILDKKTKEPIGSISIVKRNDANFNCEIGYCMSKKFWNKGLTTQALKKVIEFLFSEGYYKIEAKHDTENIASGKVMQKAGMTFAYTSPFCSYYNNKFHDCNLYYILKK